MPTGPIAACVPNVSEGRDPARLRRFRAAAGAVPGAILADLHADPDHHRAVFTILGPPPAVGAAASTAAAAPRNENTERW